VRPKLSSKRHFPSVCQRLGNRWTQQRRGASCLGLKRSLSGDTRKSSITIGDCAIPLSRAPSANAFSGVWRKKRKLCGSLSKGDRYRYGARHSPSAVVELFPRPRRPSRWPCERPTEFCRAKMDWSRMSSMRRLSIRETGSAPNTASTSGRAVEIPCRAWRVREMPSTYSRNEGGGGFDD
jgi:hypothetical protein